MAAFVKHRLNRSLLTQIFTQVVFVKLLFQIIKWFILINSEVQIIYKRLFNVFVELETDSEDQQKPPQPENMWVILKVCLQIARTSFLHKWTTKIDTKWT